MSILSTHLNKLESMYETSSNVLKSVSDLFISDKEFTLIHIAKNGIVDSSISSNFIMNEYTLESYSISDNKVVTATFESEDALTITDLKSGRLLIKYEIPSSNANNIIEEKEVTINDVSNVDTTYTITFNEDILFKTADYIDINSELMIYQYPLSDSFDYIDGRVTMHGGLMNVPYNIHADSFDSGANLIITNTYTSSTPTYNLYEMLYDYLAGGSTSQLTTHKVKIKIVNSLDEYEFFYINNITYVNDLAGSNTETLTLNLNTDNNNLELTNGESYDIYFYKLFDSNIIEYYNQFMLNILDSSSNSNYYNINSVRGSKITINSINVTDSIDFKVEGFIDNINTNDFTLGIYRKYQDFDYYKSILSETLYTNTLERPLLFNTFKYMSSLSNGKYNLYVNPRDEINLVQLASNTGSFYYRSIEDAGDEGDGTYYSLPTQSAIAKYNSSSDKILGVTYSSVYNKNLIVLNKDVMIPVKIKMDDGNYTVFYLYNKIESSININLDADTNYIISVYVYYFSNYNSSGFKLGINMRPAIENYHIKYPNETIIGGIRTTANTSTEVLDGGDIIINTLWDVNNRPNIDLVFMINNYATNYDQYWRRVPNLNKYFIIKSYSNTTLETFMRANTEEMIYLIQNRHKLDTNSIDFGKVVLYKANSEYYTISSNDTSAPYYSIKSIDEVPDSSYNIVFMIDGI